MILLYLPYKAYLSFKAYLVTIEINIRLSFAWTLDGMVDIIENYDAILESVDQFYIKFVKKSESSEYIMLNFFQS